MERSTNVSSKAHRTGQKLPSQISMTLTNEDNIENEDDETNDTTTSAILP